MESSQEGAEAKLESPTEKFDFERHVLILERLLEGEKIQWNEVKNELEHVPIEKKMKRDERSSGYLASKIEWIRSKAKVGCLLEQMKSVQDKGKLESQRWKVQLSENIKKAEFALQEMKCMPEEEVVEASGLEMQLEEQMARSELLLDEAKLLSVIKKVESPVLKKQLKEHIPKVESVLESRNLAQKGSKIKAPELGMQLKELEFLLDKLKLESDSGKVKSSELRFNFEAHIVKLKLLLDGTELEKEKAGLGSQMLKMEFLKELSEEGFVVQKQAQSPYLEKILSLPLEMKSEQEGEGLEPQVLEVISEQKEKEEHTTTLKSLQEKKKLVREESDVESPTLEMQLKERIAELDGVLKIEKLRNVKENLKFRKLKIQLCRHIVELERLVQKMKLEEEEEGKRFRALKMELNEDIAKLELLLEETKLEERHVAELKGFILKAKKINLLREKSTTEFLTLQLEESKVELKSLLKEMELVQCFEKMDKFKHMVKFLLEGMQFKQKQQGLQSQALAEHIIRLELLVKELESTRDVKLLELKGHLEKVKFLLEAIELERGEEKLEFPAFKVQLKERMVQMNSQRKAVGIKWSKKALSLGKQLKERLIELQSLQEKAKLVQLIGRPLLMELNRHIMKLESLLAEMETNLWLPIRSKLQKHIKKSESLLMKIESERDVQILQPLVWKMVLEGYSAKWESLLAEDIKLEQEIKLKSPTLEIELKQHIAKLESLIVEMKLEQEEERLGYQVLAMELEEHILKSELLLEERELICDVDILKSTVSKIQLEEHLGKVKSRLATTKLGQEKRNLVEIMLKEHIIRLNALRKEIKSERKEVKLESSGADVVLEHHVTKLEILLEEMKLEPKKEKLGYSTEGRKLIPPEQKATSPLIAQRPIIVIGGRGQDGQSLNFVEGYIFLEGRWIELPAMNTPRSFMSSVVVGNEIVVSGGDTGDAITDTIEVLNLAETPLQWKVSPAKLPVPLSAHQTAVYKEKLIVIGGHDGNKGRNSDKIYEILLKPPYESRILSFLFIPVAWHGAELVGNEIFIFGGGRNSFVSTSDILAFDLSSSTLSKRQSLPRAMKGMATVMKGQNVAVVGGLDDNEQELDEVFMYDTRSGEHHSLPEMNDKRGGCSAVASFTLETRSSCSSEKFTDALFAVGSVRSLNTVEGYSFESHRWTDMPPTRKARGFCSTVVAPIEFDTFIEHMIE